MTKHTFHLNNKEKENKEKSHIMEDQIDFFLRKLFKLIQLLQTLPPNVFLITYLTMDIKNLP